MQALIATDLEFRALALQGMLSELGVDCPRGSIVSLQDASAALRTKSFDVVIVICPPAYSDSVRVVSALRMGTKAPMLAAGSISQVGDILNLIRAGATDYLDLEGNVASDLANIVRRLQIAQPGQDGKLTCLLSSSGGCGASTLAVNLGASLATHEHPVCLLDLNFRGGDLAVLLNAQPRHTLVDLCCQGQRLDEAMFQQSLVQHSPSLKLLAAPPYLTRFSGIDLDAVDRVVRMARAAFRHLLIDLEDTSHPEQSQAIRTCDQLIVLLRMDFPCLLRARRLLDKLREEDIDFQKIRLIANRVGNAKSLSQKQAVEALGMPVFYCLPEDEAVMLTSVNVGNPVVFEAPHSKISKAYRKLAELIAL
jgi:pilus assembly protein CpaE